MKRILLIILFCLLPGIACGQMPAYQIVYGPALPPVCNNTSGDVFILTAGVTGLYRCTAANTWDLISSSGAASVFLAGDGALGGPAYSFLADPTTGFYRSAVGEVTFSDVAEIRTVIGDTFTFNGTANNMMNFTLTGFTNHTKLLRVDAGDMYFRMQNTANTGTLDTDGFDIVLQSPTPHVRFDQREANSNIIFTVQSVGTAWTIHNTGALLGAAVLFANLPGAPTNGMFLYCSDCTIANPCAAAGTGALAKRLNGVWVCN